MEIPASSSASAVVPSKEAAAAAHAAMYDKPEFVGHSLWLVPPPAVAEKLAGVIAELATTEPSLASAGCPAFGPHMTLLSGLRGLADDFVVGRAAELAADLRPIKVDLVDVVQGPKFFQCVFAVAQKTPMLMAANAAGQSAFGLSYDFVPHVSLVYGEHARIGDAGKAAAVERAKVLLRGLRSSAAGADAAAAEAAGAPLLSFDASTVEVWNTAGPVSAWRRIAAFELGAGASEAQADAGAPASVEEAREE